MGDSTGISWTDATWNPVRGCSRVSAGCMNCYAEHQAARIVRMGVTKKGTNATAYDGLVKLTAAGEPRWTGEVRMVPEHLADPLRWKKPRRIFANSMSDLFHEKLTNAEIAAVFGVMAAAPRHTFQVLTKRSARMREWFSWVGEQTRRIGEPAHRWLRGYAAVRIGRDDDHDLEDLPPCDGWPLPNVWIGVSVENQEVADERITDLLLTPASLRFLSCEPLLGPVDLDQLQTRNARDGLCYSALRHHSDRYYDAPLLIDWVIAGCESGPGARTCNVSWLRALRDQCAEAGTPFFLKQALREDEPDRSVRDDQGAIVPSSRRCVFAGTGSKTKAGGVIELPYLDGVQHAAFPEAR